LLTYLLTYLLKAKYVFSATKDICHSSTTMYIYIRRTVDVWIFTCRLSII